MIRADLVHVAKSTGTEDKLMPILRRLETNEGSRPAGWPNKGEGDPVFQKRKPHSTGKSIKYRKKKTNHPSRTANVDWRANPE